ncbi:heparinase II/III family protein [Acetobacter conturbans]|uniref:Heparinase n=1 Tax=Acetobacter conturbans TaxID=1737472 RepID=A0ABX0JWY6_9PROT|nr:heparinase II/III family protein [Acetobacter conturbans]NHN87992.1 heparinase [Acetobacter conturbans]
MGLGRWWRDVRFSFALLGPLGGLRSIPSAPNQTIRDLWPGDAACGELLVRGRASHHGVTRTFNEGQWAGDDWPASFQDWFQSFEWLRDLRDLGSESARTRARSMVAAWISQPMGTTPLDDPAITGARIASWLAQYDFFAASADEDYRRSLLGRIVLEARTIMVLMPTSRHDWTALRGLKGLLAAAVAIPDQRAFLSRFMRLIDPELEIQVLPDGCHATRSPGAQFLVLRELAEIRLILQTARIPMPTTLASALDRMAPVLRAFRHGDGRLALFNGTWSHDPSLIDLIITRAMPRGHVLARTMKDGRFVRASSGNAVLFVDAGGPPPPGFDKLAHGGLMSMEFSSGRSQIVVNCGASPLPGWHEALRDAPAHSVLSVPKCPPVLWRRDGEVDVRPDVTWEHSVSGTDHMIELASDCYRPAGCGAYHRRLFLAAEGADLRGEDRLGTVGQPSEFVLRFHLHPSVRIELEETDILLHTAEEVWRFRSDGYSTIEESIYFGGSKPTPTQQIVVRPAEVDQEKSLEAAASVAPEPIELPQQDEMSPESEHDTLSEEEAASIATAIAAAEESETSPGDDVNLNPASLDAALATMPELVPDTATVPLTDTEESQPELPHAERSNVIRWAFTRLDA